MLEKPKSVKYAEITIWSGMLLSAVVAVIDRQMGAITSNMFVGTLALSAIFCFIPYKIGQGRNWARYMLTVLSAWGVASMLGGETEGLTNLNIIVTWASLPLTGWTIYWLFKSESSAWFNQVKTVST